MKCTSVHPDHLQRQRYIGDGDGREKFTGFFRDLRRIIRGFRDSDATDDPVCRENGAFTFKGDVCRLQTEKMRDFFRNIEIRVFRLFPNRPNGRD